MVGNRGGNVEAFPSGAPKPPGQIHIFPIHEEVAVEKLVLKTHALKRARAIDGQRSRRTEDFPRLVVLAIVKFPSSAIRKAARAGWPKTGRVHAVGANRLSQVV